MLFFLAIVIFIPCEMLLPCLLEGLMKKGYCLHIWFILDILQKYWKKLFYIRKFMNSWFSQWEATFWAFLHSFFPFGTFFYFFFLFLLTQISNTFYFFMVFSAFMKIYHWVGFCKFLLLSITSINFSFLFLTWIPLFKLNISFFRFYNNILFIRY